MTEEQKRELIDAAWAADRWLSAFKTFVDRASRTEFERDRERLKRAVVAATGEGEVSDDES